MKAFNCDAFTMGKHFDQVVRRCIWIVFCRGLVPNGEENPLRRTILNAHVASSETISHEVTATRCLFNDHLVVEPGNPFPLYFWIGGRWPPNMNRRWTVWLFSYHPFIWEVNFTDLGKRCHSLIKRQRKKERRVPPRRFVLQSLRNLGSIIFQ